jgi:hypothetical protein
MRLRSPSEELKRFKPKQELVLPPRFFRQLLNPYKQAAKLGQFADEHADIHPQHCLATFWDNEKKRVVKLNLGYVNVRCNYLYRAASSVAELPCQNSNGVSQAVSLSRVEGAAPCELFTSEENEHRAQRSAHGAEFSEGENYSHFETIEKSPGTYVIPGQSLMGETFAQNLSNKTC